MKIAVLASGSGSNLQVLIDQLHRDTTCDIEISVVISDKRTAYALTRARQANIPIHVVKLRDFPNRNAFDAEISRGIDEYEAELIVLAGFMKVLQPQFVQKYRNRIVNIHPSLLPAFPGAHPLRDALAYGVKVSGATIHFVDEGLDTGPIIAQVSVPVYDSDNEESLHARIQIEEYKIYPQVVKLCAEGKLEISGRKVTVKET
ncbi:MAG: phosphoribosylglycinamide formyltransferase [Candidatus Poribacteria bacterium]|nr:phosphoribosylglycinamide formyltransferase [Candidatus Poribacteria bacterium]